MQMKGTPFAQYEAQNGTTYVADVNGVITSVANGDVLSLLNMGCIPSSLKSRLMSMGAVVTAALTQVVANVAATNVALTIANQTDVARQLVTTFDPGAADVTAGILTVIYKDQFGQTQNEVQSLVATASTPKTIKTTKACAILTSATVSGLVGGSSPTIEIGTNAVIGLTGEVGSFGFSVFKESQNGANVAAIGAVDATNGLYTLTTAPNSAKLLNVWYTYY